MTSNNNEHATRYNSTLTRSKKVTSNMASDVINIQTEMPCESCAKKFGEIESLKNELQLKEAKILELTRHVHQLETDPPTQNKKRRLGDLVKDDMNEAMITDSANKDITIGNLMKENESLKEKEAEKTHQNGELEKRVQEKESEVIELRKINEQISLKQIEMERVQKDVKNKLQEQNKNTNILLAERESTLDETLQQQFINNQTNEDLRKEVESLTEKLCQRETALQETQEKLAESDWLEPADVAVDSAYIYKKMETLIDTRMNNIEEKFAAIEKKIEKKEAEEKEVDARVNHSSDEAVPTFASIIGGATAKSSLRPTEYRKPAIDNFRAIMMSTKNEEMVEERARKDRSCNLIIHGQKEGTENEDASFIKNLIREIGVEHIIPKSASRIGKLDPGKKRPIKFILNNEKEKDQILMSLGGLKGKENFKRISITADYTLNERQMIKNMTEQARQKNIQEAVNSNYVYKVRGTPKNGLVLKRFTKEK